MSIKLSPLKFFSKVIFLPALLVLSSEILNAQEPDTISPVFEILKIQDGTENGAEVIYMVKSTDSAGNPLVNTTDDHIILDLEFGVDSDAERNDMVLDFPSNVVIKKGVASALITLEVSNDDLKETSENLVAMIYNPSIGTISDKLFYAKATISDNDLTDLSTENSKLAHILIQSRMEAARANSVIAHLEF